MYCGLLFGRVSYVSTSPVLVLRITLYKNNPNPFNPTTVISYQFAKTSDVELSISKILGQNVAELVSEK